MTTTARETTARIATNTAGLADLVTLGTNVVDDEAAAWAAVLTAQLVHNATAQTRRDADAAYHAACDATRGWDRKTETELTNAHNEVDAARRVLSDARTAEKTAWSAYAKARSNPALPY
jgi:hypothetical protein